MNSSELSSLGIFKRLQQLTPLWSLRRVLCMTLSILSQTRRAFVAASPRAAKTRMEIREQDFFFHGNVWVEVFNVWVDIVLIAIICSICWPLLSARLLLGFNFIDDTRERPLIEVVTKDVRTADIFDIMEVVGGEDEALGKKAVSWWKDTVAEEFSRQDVVLLALMGICALRLLFFISHVTWRLMRLMMQWYDHEDSEVENVEISSESLRKQLAVVRFCHLQFLLVVEKLQREMQESENKDTQQMLASLVITQYKDKRKVTLAEILETLRKIQAQDSCFKACALEEHLAGMKQDVEDDEAIDSQLPQAWDRLQELYASFLGIQARIIRQQRRSRNRHERSEQEVTGRCQRQRASSHEVLQELQELTRELPQGFTADMFTSLGNAIHKKKFSSSIEENLDL